MKLNGIFRFTGEIRFTKILEKVDKYEMCPNPECKQTQPKIVFVSSENIIQMVHKKKAENC